ncbi:MAG TPA: DUF998 domain-containing protein [Pseudonocardiaceae bacterium]
MRTVPWWALLSSSCAPVLLIGGWQVAAARQPGGFDPVSQTISALAARGATNPWIMTSALAGVGVCHTITAAGLVGAAVPGRVLLAAGGLATIGVAVSPLPVSGESMGHVAAASLAFGALSLWPALAWRRGVRPGPAAMLGAAAGLLGMLAWFALELSGDGPRIGLSERVLAGAQALWPLAVVLLARRR